MNFKNIQMPNFKITALIVLLNFTLSMEAQQTTGAADTETQADKDWKELINAPNDWSTVGTAEERKAYGAPGTPLLDNHRLTDKYLQKNSRLAEAFWNNYPQDERREEALIYFFKAYYHPTFIPKTIPDSLVKALASIPSKEFIRFNRTVPLDGLAYEQWREKGNDMVGTVLASNATLERKEVAEFLLIAREYRAAFRWFSSMPRDSYDTDYWKHFDRHYWEHIRLRLTAHMNKYASLEIVSNRVQNILGLLGTQYPLVAETYWKYFFDATKGSNQAGIKALHELAAENVAALEALKKVDFTKPLDMAFTAMDGTEVDLTQMHGKVVLIDFWATYCPPCIEEMPYVRALYDKYRDQGFEVIGIAADSNNEKVNSILKRTTANWPQYLDKGPDATISFHALYEIKALPTVWLLNKEGVIVDRNARGERLEPLIREYLGLNK